MSSRPPAAARLLVLASRERDGGVSLATPLLGLPIACRIALAASRAGFQAVFEQPPGAPLAPLLEGTGAGVIARSSDPAASEPRPLRTVLLQPGILPQARWLESLARGGPAGEAPSDTPGSFAIRSAADLPGAERWLLSSLVKDDEGFMSRHVERRISLAISRRLAATSVTPNAMTVASVLVGLAGSAFFLSPRPALQFMGALLFLFHSILDGCDGELARLKFQESRFGGVLDFWGDNVVHAAVFVCIALGWSRSGAAGALWPLLAGIAAVAGTLLSAAFVYRFAMGRDRDRSPQFTSVSRGPGTRLSRMADALARRDFIYVVVVLSAFGKAHWFLVMAAIGAPAFFLALVAIGLSSRRLGRSYS
ncbi:MAG: CDP-alcohol phosphatidyltransferase family protein [Acidobacteriota bacterium]|nr:CDP-alcohol phosphatidyltransferase family protein [Acidobacteriota bacterium]